LQKDVNGIDHPICYFSKKFDKHQKNYSTIEKECLALLLVLQHFNVYGSATVYPVLVFTVHNPLTFILKMKNKKSEVDAMEFYSLIRHRGHHDGCRMRSRKCLPFLSTQCHLWFS